MSLYDVTFDVFRFDDFFLNFFAVYKFLGDWKHFVLTSNYDVLAKWLLLLSCETCDNCEPLFSINYKTWAALCHFSNRKQLFQTINKVCKRYFSTVLTFMSNLFYLWNSHISVFIHFTVIYWLTFTFKYLFLFLFSASSCKRNTLLWMEWR